VSSNPRFIIYAHNATYDKLHQVATLGLTAAAMGKDVTVILLFWTIKKLAADGLFRELKARRFYQKPSVKKKAKEREAARRRQKWLTKRTYR